MSDVKVFSGMKFSDLKRNDESRVRTFEPLEPARFQIVDLTRQELEMLWRIAREGRVKDCDCPKCLFTDKLQVIVVSRIGSVAP